MNTASPQALGPRSRRMHASFLASCDSLALTAVVCSAMIGLALMPEFMPNVPSQWRTIGIVGLASCVGLSELRRSADRRAFASLSETCTIDLLTGVGNHRCLARELYRNLSHLRRQGAPLAALMLDIDNLDHVNDRWGREAGDLVLCSVARVVCATLRDMDILTRYDGDRFIAILPATKLSDAETAAERIRSAVEEMVVVCGKSTVQVTVSVGVAAAVTLDTENSLLTRAEAARSNAKQLGKNRSCSQSMALAKNERPLTGAADAWC